MTIHVRVFAALRELAGTSQLEASGRTVGEVSDALSAVQGERFAQIAAVSTFVVNGDRATRDTLIADGDEVAILPPVSGGWPSRPARARGAGGPGVIPPGGFPQDLFWANPPPPTPPNPPPPASRRRR